MKSKMKGGNGRKHYDFNSKKVKSQQSLNVGFLEGRIVLQNLASIRSAESNVAPRNSALNRLALFRSAFFRFAL